MSDIDFDRNYREISLRIFSNLELDESNREIDSQLKKTMRLIS